MAVKVKHVDLAIQPMDRCVTWTQADFSANDILDVYSSLTRHGIEATIEASSGASITFRVNSYNIRYPLIEEAVYRFQAPNFDLSNGTAWTNTDAESFTVSNGESLVLSRQFRNLEITALTAGNGVTVKVR